MNRTAKKKRAPRHVVEIGDEAKRRLDRLARVSKMTMKAYLGDLLQAADERRVAECKRVKEWGEVLP